mgnify:CR=1 FL=1
MKSGLKNGQKSIKIEDVFDTIEKMSRGLEVCDSQQDGIFNL